MPQVCYPQEPCLVPNSIHHLATEWTRQESNLQQGGIDPVTYWALLSPLPGLSWSCYHYTTRPRCRSFPACQLFFCWSFMVRIHRFCRTLKPSKSSHDFTLHLEINILMDAARIERAPERQPFMCLHVEHAPWRPFRLAPLSAPGPAFCRPGHL